MPIEIPFVGSSLTECILVGKVYCIKINWRKALERELATQHSTKIDEKWEC